MSNFLTIPASSYVSTPNQSPAMNPGANPFEVIACVQMSNWVPAASAYVVASSFVAPTTNERFVFLITSTGTLGLAWYDSAVALQNSPSSVATGFAANAIRWIRAVVTPSAGTVAYYTSADVETTAPGSVTWTQLGTTRTGLSTSSVNVPVTPSATACGQNTGGLGQWTGNIYRVRYAINGSTVFDMDWTTAAGGSGPWTSGTGETWTGAGTASVTASGTNVSAPPASSTGSAPAPVTSMAVPEGTAGLATASAPAPSFSSGSNTSVAAPSANASASSPTSALSMAVPVTTAYFPGDMIDPTDLMSPVDDGAALAVASAPTPGFTIGASTSISAPPASATASIAPPSFTGGATSTKGYVVSANVARYGARSSVA